MTPVAYRITSVLGAVSYYSVTSYDVESEAEALKSREIRGLYLSPQPDCPPDAEVYLHSGDSFWEPFEVSEGVCPNDCLSLYLGPVIQEADGVLLAISHKVQHSLRSLLLKLAKFHWSPNHPSTYTISHSEHGKPVGLGLIAMKNPASFNLVYAEMNGELDTALKQMQAVTLFAGFDTMLQSENMPHEFEANVTLMTEEDFRKWMQDARNYEGIPDTTINRVREALKLPEVRGV